MILCDIGNTTYHFKVDKKDFKISINEEIDKLPSFDGSLYFISVNKKGTKKFLKKYPNAINLEKKIS